MEGKFPLEKCLETWMAQAKVDLLEEMTTVTSLVDALEWKRVERLVHYLVKNLGSEKVLRKMGIPWVLEAPHCICYHTIRLDKGSKTRLSPDLH